MKAAAPKSAPRTIAAGEFKAKRLEIIDETHRNHREVVITKRGVPMAQLVPFSPPGRAVFRSLLGRSAPIRIADDIIAPLPEEDTIPVDPLDDA